MLHARMWPFVAIVWSSMFALSMAAKIASANTAVLAGQPSSSNLLRRFMSTRSPSATQPTYWSYSGQLRSTEDGSVIADIRGLECCKTIGAGNVDSSSEAVTSQLLARRQMQLGDEFQSIMSRKSFVYTEHGTNEPLRVLGRGWTKRTINPSMRMDQIITVAAKPNDGVVCHVQWPGNRELFSQQISINQRKSWWSQALAITSYMHPRSSAKQGSRWVAFGPPPPKKDGSLEYYNYAITPWSAEGQMRRFGESPPWWGLQKKASTELRFQRHSSLNTVPKTTLALVRRCDPGFFDMPRNAADFSKLPDPRIQYLPWWRRIQHWATNRGGSRNEAPLPL